MKELAIVFVTPKHSGIKAVAGELVCTITGSCWSHVAIMLADSIFEAILPDVSFQPKDKYTFENTRRMEVLTIAVSDNSLQKMEKLALKLIKRGTKYGLRDCIAGGASVLFGRKIGRKVALLLNCAGRTADCSETVTRLLCESTTLRNILRDAGIYLVDADIVTPQALYNVLKPLAEKERKRVRYFGTSI